MNPVYVWNWAFSRFLQKLALSNWSSLTNFLKLKFKIQNNCVVRVKRFLDFPITAPVSNNCSSFKALWPIFFETKNVNSVLEVKRFLDFSIKAPLSKDNCKIFIMVNNLPEFHQQYTAKEDYHREYASEFCNKKNTRTHMVFLNLQKNTFTGFKVL